VLPQLVLRSDAGRLHALHVFVSKQRLLADGHTGKQTLISNGTEKTNTNMSTNASSMAVSLSAEVHRGNSQGTRTIVRWSSSLERFGIYRQKITRTKRRGEDDSIMSSLQDEDDSHEEIYLWACRILGTGIRWSRRHLYGTVSSSMSTYPVVADFPTTVWNIMERGEVSDLEQTFRKGELHPYTRDSRGRSLHHVSIDMSPCRVLCYNVKLVVLIHCEVGSMQRSFGHLPIPAPRWFECRDR
jgi:hypothetical protein